MKKLVIIGKPNVGKSSLFNRLTKQKDAITSNIAGTTRDIKKRVIELNNKSLQIIDTGGIDDSNELFLKIKEKALKVAKEADIILFMVDGKTIPLQEERELFFKFQKLNKDIALVINKIDNDKEKEIAWENFASFGSKIRFEISVSHNKGIAALLNWIDSLLPQEELELKEDDDYFEIEDEEFKEIKSIDTQIKVAIIGRVNVGKSSLLNALVGEDRSIVSDIAGTTIDPVDESIFFEGKEILFVDTAGIRRRGKIEGIEKFALDRTKNMLEKAHIAILVLDSKEGFVELDEKIGGLIDEYKLGAIIVLNKWDESKDEYKKIEKEVRDRFKYLSYAPIITASALKGRNIQKIKKQIIKVYNAFFQHIPTSQLNRVIKEATLKHPIPSDRGKLIKIYYATQFDVAPPKIALIMNRPVLHFSYIRYLTNVLRENFDLEGTPIIIKPKHKGEKEEIEEKESGI